MDQVAAQVLTGHQLLEGVNHEGSIQGGALDGGVHITGDDGVKRGLGGVAANDENVLAGHLAGGLDGVDCAQRHVVIVGQEDVDLVMGLQEALHDGLAFGTGEVAALGGNNLQVGGVFQNFHDALLAAASGVSTSGAFQDDHVEFFA
ncbi:hypothetical protein SDC9_194828 [bioreactor metagenome]|uniref:Uncharacterized protein n=1 Tax=bioreactor metagenome TaxID=1076179 RepID=A0A645I7B9_9ZZZZ